MPNLPKLLTVEEKKYLVAVERGDMANVKRILQLAKRKKNLDIDCVDSLGRGALTISIDQENLEMVELLIVMGVQTKDALLHAINVEFVEAVELLLEHEEIIHKDGEPHSWQRIDSSTASFTPDITPLVLAAHRNNYEILKILLDRGATLPMPHEIKCGCDECITLSQQDSLRQALSRLNEYKALASPSLIALSSSDPILTAFQLSWELRGLAFAEPECKSEYLELRKQCQQFAVDLLHQSRSSQELAIILNHDPDDPSPYKEGEHMRLSRLELAIHYKQKKFVSHPNIQQLLAAIWYEGVPGFRRKTNLRKIGIIVKVALLFPFYCMLYIVAPNTETGKLMRKPFMKFLIHASSYLFFLLILILVSQRAEDFFIENFGTQSWKESVIEKYERQRGNPPMLLEYVVLIYVLGFIVEETHEMFSEGFSNYLRNMWNIIDFTRNSLYTAVFFLRVAAYLEQNSEIARNPGTAYLRREEWAAFDFQLVAEGLFAAANIFSALKLVHLFSINPHLGPLQISLGRMVIDIVKFFFIYTLVLFAFACGLNQLLWYFSDLERQKCFHLPNGNADFDHFAESCMKWRRFANVFESSQSLFWASFGLVDLSSFELTGIKTYTRFWGLLMFGSYSVINVIVLLNLLIAMMSNSYAIIEEHSDTEWKFARTKLWLSYFEESATLPPPFNLIPTPKLFLKFFGLRKKDKLRKLSSKRRKIEEKERDYKYSAVMRSLVWRYVTAMHKKEEENPVTEDVVNEIKSDISSFRFEILEVLNRNGMDTSSAETKEKAILGKKNKVWERRLMKDFKVSPVVSEEDEEFLYAPTENETATAKFRRIAKLAILNSGLNKWRRIVKGACIASQIGHCHSRDSFKKQQNLQKAMIAVQNLPVRSTDSSRSVTPIDLPDVTGLSISNLLQNFEDIELDQRSPFRSNNEKKTSPAPQNARPPSFKYILGSEFPFETPNIPKSYLPTSPEVSMKILSRTVPVESEITTKEPILEESEYSRIKNELDETFVINTGTAEQTNTTYKSPKLLVTYADGQNIPIRSQEMYDSSLTESSDINEKVTNSPQEKNNKQFFVNDSENTDICKIKEKQGNSIDLINDKDSKSHRQTKNDSTTEPQVAKYQTAIVESEHFRPPLRMEQSEYTEILNNYSKDDLNVPKEGTAPTNTSKNSDEKVKCSSVTFSTDLNNEKYRNHKPRCLLSTNTADAPLKTALKNCSKTENEKHSISSTLSPYPTDSTNPITPENGKSPLGSREIRRVKKNQLKFGWL